MRYFSLMVFLIVVHAGMTAQSVIYSTGFSPSDTAGWGEMSEFTTDLSSLTGMMGWSISTSGTPTSFTGPEGPHEGNHYVYFEHSCGFGNTNLCPDKEYSLISPPIILAGTNSTLSFYYLLYGDPSSTPSRLEVSILSNGGANSTKVFTAVNGIHADGSIMNWTEAIIDLTAFDGQQIRIEFLGVEGPSNGRGDIGIDTLKVMTTPIPIPTLGSWAIIILGLLLLILSFIGIMSKKQIYCFKLKASSLEHE